MFSDLAKEKIFFTQHLFLMIKGGLPISEALETLKEEAKVRTFKKVLDGILKRVLEGESLNEALARHPRIFNQFFQSIVRVGEESGTLEGNLEYLNSQLRSEYEIKKKIKGALLYPAIIIILAIVIALTTTLFILPKVTNLFKMLNIELPLATRTLIKSTIFFQKNWILIIVGIIFFILIFRLIKKVRFFKYYFDKSSLSLPIVGQIFRNLNLARFSQSFYTLLKSGIPILETLEICSQNLPNEVFKKNLSQVQLEVEKGGKVSQGLKNFPEIFPLIFSQMVSIGERSGTLEDSLLYLTNFYQNEVDTTLKSLSGILEPILLILVGIFVGFVALAIITPLYKFTGGLRFR